MTANSLKKLALKKVVQLDYTGKFLGITLAQEHPYNEGEWMMPEYAVDVTLPINMKDNCDYFYHKEDNGGYWEEVKKPEPPKKEEQKAPELSDLDKAKIYRSNALRDYTVIIDDMEFQADDDSLNAMQQYIEYGEEDFVDWVLKDNSVKKVSKELLRKVMSKAITFKTTQWSKVVTHEKEWSEFGQNILEERKITKNN